MSEFEPVAWEAIIAGGRCSIYMDELPTKGYGVWVGRCQYNTRAFLIRDDSSQAVLKRLRVKAPQFVEICQALEKAEEDYNNFKRTSI